MKYFKHMLRALFFAPAYSLFGIPDGDGSAPGDAGGDAGDTGAAGGESNEGNQNGSGQVADTSNKSFTQEDVTRIGANEKRQGRQQAFKDLGTDEATAKKALALYNKLQAETQTPDDKVAAEATKTATETAARIAAEQKLDIHLAGCQKDYVTDVYALTSAAVANGEEFKDALEAVKKKHGTWFEAADGTDTNNGTGPPAGANRKKSETGGSFGKAAAEAQKSAVGGINPDTFFK